MITTVNQACVSCPVPPFGCKYVGGDCNSCGKITCDESKSFRYATWQCYDGYSEKQGSPSSCKTSQTWSDYAQQSCNGRCSSDGSKCGVNSFGVDVECGLPTCVLCPVLPSGCKYVGGDCNSCGKIVCEPVVCKSTSSILFQQTKTFIYPNGKNYEVSWIPNPSAKDFSFIVNGENVGLQLTETKTLTNGDKFTLSYVTDKGAYFCINGIGGNENPVCGNNICEEGEADYCPPCTKSNPPCGLPCQTGKCPQDCQQTEVKEQVKCVFNSDVKGNCDGDSCIDKGYIGKCYSEKGECSGIYSCDVTVKGKKGEQVTWKSSCGGYVYTTIDGQDEYAYFSCGSKSITKQDVIDYINNNCFDKGNVIS